MGVHPHSDREIEFGAVDLFREGSTDLAFAVIQYTAGDHDMPPQTIDVRFDPFFDEVDGRDGLLLIDGGFELGEFALGKETLVNVNADERTKSIDLGADGRWGNFRSSISLGINHIATGPDHILFVLAILIPSVLVFTNRSEPVAGFVRCSSGGRLPMVATKRPASCRGRAGEALAGDSTQGLSGVLST